MKLSCLVRSKDQLEAVLHSEAQEIALESSIADENEYKTLTDAAKRTGKAVYLALPAVFRAWTRESLIKAEDAVKAANFDGFLVRSLEELAVLSEIGIVSGEKDCDGPRIIADNTIPVWNRFAKDHLLSHGITRVTAPFEIGYRTMREVGFKGQEVVVYGRIPMMFSENCLYKTTTGCHRSGENGVLIDRMRHEMIVIRDCKNCFNTIFNNVPLSLLTERKAVASLNPYAGRLSFTDETGDETAMILCLFERAFLDEIDESEPDKMSVTHGRFRRGY